MQSNKVEKSTFFNTAIIEKNKYIMYNQGKMVGEKMKKNTITKLLIIIFIITAASITGLYMIQKPITTKKSLTTDLSSAPANNAFNDAVFYQCIVKEYNKENEDDLDDNAYLNDSQLSTITHLRCSSSNGEYVTDATGIEKLTSLTELDMSSAHLQIIDLSENKELISLNVALNYGYLTKLDISKNKKLERLIFYDSYLTELSDLSNNTALKYVDGDTARLTEIDFSNNAEIEYVDLNGNCLTEITGINNKPKLKTLQLSGRYGQGITNIDISNDTVLETLSLRQNKLQTIELDDNTALKSLDISSNKLNNINLLHNLQLTNLDISNNQLENINLDNQIQLVSLNLSRNNLSSLNLINNTAIENLNLYSNNFNTTQYIYKGEHENFINTVKLPTQISEENKSYISNDESIATVSNDGIITAIGLGNVDLMMSANNYDVTNHISIVEIESSKYNIDEENNRIFVGIEKINNIIKNISSSEGINVEYDRNSKKVLIKHNDKIIKEFNIVGIITDKYSSEDKKIYIGNKEIPYSEFINDIEANGVNIKIIDGDNEITSGNIKSGMKLQLRIDETLLDTYDIVGDTAPKNADNNNKNSSNSNDEKVAVDNTSKRKSIIISIIGVFLFIIGGSIITVIINNNKKKKDNI